MICYKGLRKGEGVATYSYEEITTLAISELTETQKAKETAVDSIVAQGMSGMMVALPVAHVLGIPCLTVGREGEKYGTRVVNAQYAGQRVLFMDDHYGAGSTLVRCGIALRDWVPGGKAKIVATYFYNPSQRDAARTALYGGHHGGFTLLNAKHNLHKQYTTALAMKSAKKEDAWWMG